MNGSRNYRLRSVAVAISALAVTGLAACGESSTPSGTTPARFSGSAGSICSDVTALNRLTLHRTEEFPQDDLQFGLPATLTLDNDAVAVQAVATAACALPIMPSGPISCPNDQGIGYLLTFSTTATTLPSLTLSAGGCQPLNGLPGTRWSPGPLWNALGSALHLISPYDQDFQGRPSR